MATRGYLFQSEKLDKFGREDHEDVDDILITIDMYLRGVSIPGEAPAEMKWYKVVILHRHLVGQAKEYWTELNPTSKTT